MPDFMFDFGTVFQNPITYHYCTLDDIHTSHTYMHVYGYHMYIATYVHV